MGVLSSRVGSSSSGLGRGSATTGRTFSTGSAAAFAPTGQFDEPVSNTRPFRDIGKQNLSLVPTAPVTPLGMEQAKPFSGVPVLGALFEGLNAAGSLPIGGILKTLPGIGGIASAVETQNMQTWNANVGKAGEWLAKNPVDPRTGQSWMSDQAKFAAFTRDWNMKHGGSALLQHFQDAMTPTTAGDLLMTGMTALSAPGMLFQRGLAGSGLKLPGTEGTRLKDLADATPEDLENNAELIRIRDEYKNGDLSDNEALDRLVLAGYAITNPLSPAVKKARLSQRIVGATISGLPGMQALAGAVGKPGQNWVDILADTDIADDTPLGTVFGVMNRTIDAAASLGLEVVTDPVNLLSVGTASGVKLTAKGVANVMARASDVAVERALAERGFQSVIRDGAVRGATEEADNIALRARMEFRQSIVDEVPAGGSVAERSLVRQGLRSQNPVIAEAMQEGLRQSGRMDRLAVSSQRALQYTQFIENALDPLTLFGRDAAGKVTQKMSAVIMTNAAVRAVGGDAIAKVLGSGLRIPGRAASGMAAFGLEEEGARHLGIGFANAASQLGAQEMASREVRMGMTTVAQGIKNVEPAVVSDLATDMTTALGKSVDGHMAHKVDKLGHVIVAREGETMKMAIRRERETLAGQWARAYGRSAEDGIAFTKGMSERDLRAVRWMLYGKRADDLLKARRLAVQEAEQMGLDPTFAKRMTFMGPAQLTQQRLKALRKAIKKKDYDAIRVMVEQYDVLEYNIGLGKTNDQILSRLNDLMPSLEAGIPKTIPKNRLTPAMKDFVERYGDDVEVGLMPENVWAIVQDADGKVIGVNPWVDYVDGEAQMFDAVSAPGRMRQWKDMLFGGISGAQVRLDQTRRFIQMASVEGLSEAESTRLLRVMRNVAEERKASSIRGLSSDEMYEAAKTVLTKRMRKKLTQKELQRLVMTSHQGSLRVVGTSQYFTGGIKRAPVGGGQLAYLAERLYPKVRFAWNPLFQGQEAFETPILLLARGMVSPNQLLAVPEAQGRALARSIRGEGDRARIFKELRADADNLNYQTAILKDQYSGGTRYANDQSEFSDAVMAGGISAARLADAPEGRTLVRLVEGRGVPAFKARGEMVAYRRFLGNWLRDSMGRESPVQYQSILAHYGTTDPGEAAVRYLFDLQARADPVSMFSAIDASHRPEAFFRPSFLGERTRWDHRIVLEALKDDGKLPGGVKVDLDSPKRTFNALTKAYQDPKNTDITSDWLEQTLRARGADEWYIERTKWRLGEGNDEEEFAARLAEVAPGGEPEARAIMDFHREQAKLQGISLLDHLTNQYARAPTTIDQFGNYKANTLYQTIADTWERRGFRTVPKDDPLHVAVAEAGTQAMPEFRLRPATAELSWQGHPLAQHTELVPLRTLVDMPKGNRPVRLTPKEMRDLDRNIKTNGMQEPLQVTYYSGDNTVRLDEGNHRVQAMLDGGANPDTTMVPVTSIRYMGSGDTGMVVRGRAPDEYGYTPANLKPSDIGLVDPEQAALARHSAEMKAGRVKVEDLTGTEKKARAALVARDQRVADPTVGAPGVVRGSSDGRIVASGMNGEPLHRLGEKTNAEWQEELLNNFTDDELKDISDWYLNMRQSMLVLGENDPEQAAHLAVAFGLTQLNTSPVAGMQYMWRALERQAQGLPWGDDLKAMQQMAGLNAVQLQKLVDQYRLESGEGLGQKLVDFIDSLLGNGSRSIPVHGPEGRWQPVAGDIWAKRDLGFVDPKMDGDYMRHLFPPEQGYEVRATTKTVKARKTKAGTTEQATSFTVYRDGEEVGTIPEDMLLTDNPNDVQYDYIVDRYNSIKDDLNDQAFLGRTDWTAADVQAMGWFKAKKVMGDDTGDVRAAFFNNSYNVSVLPTESAVVADIFPPDLDEATAKAIAGRVGPVFIDRAAEDAQVRVTAMNGSLNFHSPTGIGHAINAEVMGSRDAARNFALSLGGHAHQGRVIMTSPTTTKPTAQNAARHAVFFRYPIDTPKEEVQGVLRELAEKDPFFRDGQVTLSPAGEPQIQVHARPGETERAFKARGSDETLRKFYRTAMDPTGMHPRGRYVSPERYDQLEEYGRTLLRSSGNRSLPIIWLDDNADELLDDIHVALREEHGGLTIDAHNGRQPKAVRGGGPYASAIGDTLRLPLDASDADIADAYRTFVAQNRSLLERGDAHLGVFRNQEEGGIDFDVVQVVDDYDDAEALQTALGRTGGAYDYSTGNGVFIPQLNAEKDYAFERGFLEVHEFDGGANGAGHVEALRGTDSGRPIAEGLERDGRAWALMEYERAHGALAARETATHRASKVNDGRADLDPGVSGGQLRFGPRGHGSATLARNDARTGTSTFWQRGRGGGPTAGGGQPGGPVRGAITGAGTSRATGGTGAVIGINRRRATKDTVAHEIAHDWINRFLQESGVRRAKGIYAGREGTVGVSRRAGRPSSGKALTVDEQEWLANQFVEYLRQGEDAIAHPALRPLAAHYATTLRRNSTRGDLHPEARALFDELDARPKPPKGYTYDVDEQAMLNHAANAHARADRLSQDLIHFKSSRSWLERSLNHPYFGLYPLSYMWGKIAPELIEFLMFRPFGLKAPLVGMNMTNKLYQHVMLQQQNDPELQKFMADHEDMWRFLSMFVPGLPWDLPVNTPLWLRRYVEAAATNEYKMQMGEKPEDYSHWNALVTDIDHAKNIGDVASYAMGTVAGSRSYLELPGMLLDTVGDLQQQDGEEEDDGSAFVSPVGTPPAQQAPPIPTPQRRAQQNVTNLEAAAATATTDITNALSQSPGP